MTNRRDVFIAAAGTLGVAAFAQTASGQELPADGKALLYDMAGKLKTIAANNAVHIVYSNLVFAQLNYRIAINLNDYENAGDFQGLAYAIANQVLFEEKSRSALKEGASPRDDVMGQMIEAYGKQRQKYADMIDRMLKEGEGQLPGLTPAILVQSMAYFAVASAAFYQSIGDWFTGSPIFPFCTRSA